MAKQVIVAERTSKAGVRILLTVDPDDVVHEIAVGAEEKNGEPAIQANFGARLNSSGTLNLLNTLSSSEVATHARRITLDNGITVHVILAWGFSQYSAILSPVCWLHVFRQEKGGVTQVLASELGPELEQFVVEDINRDGRIEILVATRENAVTSMNIWQIGADSDIKKIQRIDGYAVHTAADRFMDLDEGIIVEHKKRSIDAGASCFDVDRYLWSEKQQRFVKR